MDLDILMNIFAAKIKKLMNDAQQSNYIVSWCMQIP